MKTQDTYKKIYDAAIKFLVPLSTPEVYRTIVKEAVSLTNAKEGSIFLYSDGKLKRVHTTSKELKKLIPRKEGITYQVFETHLPNLRYKEDLIRANSSFKDIAVSSDISIPLNYGHITLGVLSVLSKEGKDFSTEDLDTLNLFGPLATLAIRKTQMHEEARKSLSVRDWFISLAAHEIKNPLTAATLQVELLKRSKNIEKLPEKTKVEKLDETLQRLSHLITELLQVDRIRSGKLDYQMSEISFSEIIQRCVLEARERYPEHTVKSHRVPTELCVKGDNDKLTQAVTNIINNAVKFSKAGTTITVKVQEKDGNAVLSIRDQGEGIKKDDLKKIFHQFYRGNSDKEGMGVGLFLVKQIVSKHNGFIDIKSTYKKGTTVTMKLPLYSQANGKRSRSTTEV